MFSLCTFLAKKLRNTWDGPLGEGPSKDRTGHRVVLRIKVVLRKKRGLYMETKYRWHKKEDSWAIVIGLGFIAVLSLLFYGGLGDITSWIRFKVTPWQSWEQLGQIIQNGWASILRLYIVLAAVITVGAYYLGFGSRRFIGSFTALYVLAVVVTVLAAHTWIKAAQLEGPLLALVVGLILSNLVRLPAWLSDALRTEYYVKTGIVLMGATLPFTIILQAGPAAMGQALIVSVVTFGSIYLAATKLFGLDKRFAACLGAGGSICGVSGSIAIGGACRARQEHVSVAISLVIVWAVVMIFALPAAAKALGLHPGVAGAWIGTSEFADAAGFAAAETIGHEAAVRAFTLMKVVGRDMFVGVWAFLVAILSITLWERKQVKDSEHIDKKEIWRRFPKFIIGFFVASIVTSLVLTGLDSGTGTAYSKTVLAALKELRGWFFVLTFLSIGLTTRLRDLTKVGYKPLLAFAIGVAINVPLGYLLSTQVFQNFWLQL